MPSAKLPVEVVEKVIDAVHEHRATLLACNTVCRAWLPRARWNLYHSIHLSLRKDPARAALFVRTTHDPHLAELVDTLYLTGPDREYDHNAFGPLATGHFLASDPQARKWYTVLGLERLCNLRELHLSRSRLDECEDFLALLALFPSLDRLDVSDVDIPEAWDTGVESEDAPLVLEWNPRQSITRLTVYAAEFALPVVIAGCAPGGPFAQITHLDLADPYVTRARGEWLRLPALLRRTLQELRVSVRCTPHNYHEAREPPEVVAQRRMVALARSVKGCAALRSLLVRYNVRQKEFHSAPLCAFARELGGLRALRELALFLSDWRVSALLPGLTELGGPLGEALCDAARFPAFARLAVLVQEGYATQESAIVAREVAQIREALAGGFGRDDTRVEIAVEIS